MKIKNLILSSLLLTMAGYTFGQPITFPTKPWNATIKIVGEDGSAIGGADVVVAYTRPPYSFSDDETYHGIISGITDTNGLFLATHTDRTGSIGFRANQQGYYETRSSRTLRDPEENANDRNLSLTMALRKIGEPIAMYAKKEETKLQEEDKPVGFDLTAGDWMTPYGKGFHTDLFFTVHRKIINEREYDCNLIITFPNKGDGIMVAPSESVDGSSFKTSRTAAANDYQPELNLHYSNSDKPQGVFGYFIRVRTELNQDGTIKSALYGKIPGGFSFFAGTQAPRAGMRFDYYLNPTPNDRNLEFDTKKNLIKDLGEFEGISQP